MPRLDGSSKPIAFTADAARRIQRVVQAVEHGERSMSATRLPRLADDGEPVRLGKTTAVWNKGATATIELYEEGDPGSENKQTPALTLEGCVNHFADVGSGKWVMVARGVLGAWYLISAEC
jgi:hypothetical protein